MSQHQSIQASVAYPSSDLLGEGPVWSEERKSLFWVDIEGQILHELKWPEKKAQLWCMPQMMGMVALESRNKVILALQDGIALYDLQKKELVWLKHLEKEITANRPNDGKCDAAGRLWLGTMDCHCNSKAGSLYCIDGRLNIIKKLSSLTIANGMAWSIDSKRMYFTDSATYKVDSYLFDVHTGNIKFERTAIVIDEKLGMPDGMSIDEEGMLWIAHWNGFAVRRWDPATGRLLDVIKLPVPQVTSCSFGGNNLDELFITTAKTGLSKEQLEQYPLSGNLFVRMLTVKGIPPAKFIFYSP